MIARALAIAAAALLIVAMVTNHWLLDDDLELGLLGLRVHGETWEWNARLIQIAGEMHEPLTRSVAYTAAGISTLVAGCVAVLALIGGAVRPARWLGLVAASAVAIAGTAAGVFVTTRPELGRYGVSWSLSVFVAGAGLAFVAVGWARRRRT